MPKLKRKSWELTDEEKQNGKRTLLVPSREIREKDGADYA
jgi:hypothetical protein